VTPSAWWGEAKRSGWSWAPAGNLGGGLHTYVYIRPGCTKKTAVLDHSMFFSIEAAMRHAQEQEEQGLSPPVDTRRSPASSSSSSLLRSILLSPGTGSSSSSSPLANRPAAVADVLSRAALLGLDDLVSRVRSGGTTAEEVKISAS